jgi:cytochrome c oxidase subunit 4
MTTREHGSREYAPSATIYVITWVVLVVLATITLFASQHIAGHLGLVIALTIAAAKAGLVACFFMHLAGGRPLHRIVFCVAIAFVALLVLGVIADVGVRPLASPYVEAAPPQR